MTQKTTAVVHQWNYISNTFVQQDDASDSDKPHCQHAASGIEIEMFVGTWRPFISSYNCTNNKWYSTYCEYHTHSATTGSSAAAEKLHNALHYHRNTRNPKVIRGEPRCHPSLQRTTIPQSPHIYPRNCPFLFDDLHPHLIHISIDWPHPPPQKDRYPDPISHFATVHFSDTQTNIQTEWHME